MSKFKKVPGSNDTNQKIKAENFSSEKKEKNLMITNVSIETINSLNILAEELGISRNKITLALLKNAIKKELQTKEISKRIKELQELI